MSVINKTSLSILFGMLGSAAMSQSVSLQQAESIARSFFAQQTAPARGLNASVDLRLAHVSRSQGEVYYYAFNQGNDQGFVIVGGDRCAQEVLGYCDHGSFDLDNAPENFRWWMSQYDAQIHEAIAQGRSLASDAKSSSLRYDVPKMLETKWGQQKPFNNAIPSLGTSFPPFVTGCVATAMSQIMYYHRCPAGNGTGANTYSINYNTGTELTFSANFAQTSYDWDNMLPDYNDVAYTTTEANAVAKLMYHAGVSVNMQYNNSESGASSNKIAGALYNHFGFDKSAYLAQREYYTDEEWDELVFSELCASRPLIYGGTDPVTEGGHVFICHGYRASDQMYAINWGWAGLCDGYFRILGNEALRPGKNGTGGAGINAAYTANQAVVLNVMPDQGGDYALNVVNAPAAQNFAANMTDNQNNEKKTATLDLKSKNDALFYNFFPWNLSPVAKTFETCVMFRDVISGEVVYSSRTSGMCSAEPTSVLPHSIKIDPNDFVYNGTYEVFPAIREKGKTEWQRMRVETSVYIPTVTTVGGREPEAADINFQITGLQVEEGRTIQILHDKYYSGKVTYTASPADVVSISDEGIVTGLKCGDATITVQGEKATHYNATTATFQVKVVPYVKQDLNFTISDLSMLVGNTLTISYDAPLYTGQPTYKSSDESIATVDASGVIKGLAPGKATITAYAPGDQYYNETTVEFQVKVNEAGITLLDYTIPANGYMYYDEVELKANFRNDTQNNYSSYQIGCDITIGSIGTLQMTFTLMSWMAGEDREVVIGSLNKYADYFKAAAEDHELCSFELYDSKGEITDPILFYPCVEISIDATVGASGWSTLCLPFTAPLPSGMKAYAVTSVIGDGLIRKEVGELAMNIPYLISATPGTYTFTGPSTPVGRAFTDGLLVGNTAQDYMLDADSFAYQEEGASGPGFYRVSTDLPVELKRHTAYLVAEGYTEDFIGINASAAISSVSAMAVSAQPHDILGRSTSATQSGLIIKEGHVVFQR